MKLSLIMLMSAAALTLAACNQNQTAQVPAPASAPAEAAAPAPAAAAGTDDRRQFMLNVVAPAMKPVWDLSYADKMSDADWETVKKATADLVAAMPQIAADSRGQDPKWKDALMKVSASVDAAAKAAAAKDQKALAMAGDDLVDECGACHMAFDPGAK